MPALSVQSRGRLDQAAAQATNKRNSRPMGAALRAGHVMAAVEGVQGAYPSQCRFLPTSVRSLEPWTHAAGHPSSRHNYCILLLSSPARTRSIYVVPLHPPTLHLSPPSNRVPPSRLSRHINAPTRNRAANYRTTWPSPSLSLNHSKVPSLLWCFSRSSSIR